MNTVSWTTTTLSEAFEQLKNTTSNFLSTHGVTRTNSQVAAIALGLVGVGIYTAPRIARWFYSFRTPERLMKPNERRLTQGTLIPPTPSDSPQMHKNYQTGIELLKYASEAILFSPNYLYRSDAYRDKCNDPPSARALEKAVCKIFLKIDAQLQKEVGEDAYKLTFKEIETFAKYAVKYNVASCHGICCACLAYARNKKIKQRIEIFQIDNHVFLVIGRNPKNSLPFSYFRWERDAIVCDPWAQSCYPANEVTQHLMDLSRVIHHPLTGEQYTIVKPFGLPPQLIGELDLANPSYNESSRPELPSPLSSNHPSSRKPSEIDNQNH